MAVVGVGVAPVGVGFGGATPPKGRVLGVPSGGSDGTPGDRHWSGIQGGVSRDSAPAQECRPGGWHPFRPQRYRRAVGPGRIEPQAVLPPIFLDAPMLFGNSAAASERIGVKNPSRTGLRGGSRRPNPDTIRTGSVTAPRFRSRGTSFAVRVALPYPTSSTDLGRVCSSDWRSASLPRSRKTSDLPPGIGISIGPSIPTSTKQQNNKTTQHIRGA